MPEQPNGPRKPWVSQAAMEFMACRRALAAEGHAEQAKEMDKMVRAQVREDRANWIANGLRTKLLEPLRTLKRKKAPEAVALYPPWAPCPGAAPPAPVTGLRRVPGVDALG